jgi:hypothetical protein
MGAWTEFLIIIKKKKKTSLRCVIDVRYEEDKPSSHQHEPPAHVGLSGGSGTDVVFFVLKNMKKHLK